MPLTALLKPASLTIATATAAVVAAISVPAFSQGSQPRPPAEADRPIHPNRVVLGGDKPAELLYVPLTAACKVAATTVKPNKVRSLRVAGDSGFSGQGGKATGCGIPLAATSVVASVTIGGATRAGQLRAWAAGSAPSKVAAMLYPKKAPALEQLTLALRPGAGTDLSVKSVAGKAKLTMLATGYFVPQMQAYISSSGSIIDQSGRLLSAEKTGTGTYKLTWDRDVSSCSGQASSDITGHIMSVYTSASISYVYIRDDDGVASDYWSNVLITC